MQKLNIKKYYLSIASITILVLLIFTLMFFFTDYFKSSVQREKKIYYVDNISASLKFIIDRFNQLNEGRIEVVPIDLPFEKFSTNERKELLIRFLRSNSDKVDIFSVDQIWVPRFAKWTEPLDKYFLTDQRKHIINQIIQTCYFNGSLVAMPLYYDIGVLYYNDLALKKLSNYSKIKNELANYITWERFISISKELKRINPSVYLFPADNYEGLMCSFVEMLGSQNEKLFVGDSVRINTHAAHNALQLLADLVNNFTLSPVEVTNYRESECYFNFVIKQIFFMKGWPGFFDWYKRNIKEEDVSNIYLKAPMPHFRNGKPASIIGGWNLMLSKFSTKKSEAMEFIKYLLSEEIQKMFFEKGGYLPVVSSIYSDTLFVKKYPDLQFYKNLLSTGIHRPFSEKYTRCSDIIASYLHMAIMKKIKINEALEKAQSIINSNDIFIK